MEKTEFLISCFLAVFIIMLGFEMHFGWDWIKLLVIFSIAGIITSPLSWSVFIERLIKKSQEKNGAKN